MGTQSGKWFSMRADFWGPDAYELGLYKLSPQALALYFSSVAYASRWGIDSVTKHEAAYVGIKRPSAVFNELLQAGFFVRSLRKDTFHIAHEGVLWRRGIPSQRRTIPLAIRAAVMERDGYACVFCGETDVLTLDHIWPYSKGGRDTVDNLRVLCRSCNSAKGDRTDVTAEG